ncbi:MAG TPA: hypothetical protein VG013_17520 [Gemmataceae bacterium]|jgi:hypothetical protein|nr:hypothetical protein [Gemmataceae bacterium]
MGPRRLGFVLLVPWLCLLGACSSPARIDEPHHVGPTINIADFIKNTAAYNGKSITLRLTVEEDMARSRGHSLRDYVGRDVKFTKRGPKGELLNLVITIPKGLSVPEAGNSDEVFVTFVCTRGSLRQGNEARSIETP